MGDFLEVGKKKPTLPEEEKGGKVPTSGKVFRNTRRNNLRRQVRREKKRGGGKRRRRERKQPRVWSVRKKATPDDRRIRISTSPATPRREEKKAPLKVLGKAQGKTRRERRGKRARNGASRKDDIGNIPKPMRKRGKEAISSLSIRENLFRRRGQMSTAVA